RGGGAGGGGMERGAGSEGGGRRVVRRCRGEAGGGGGRCLESEGAAADELRGMGVVGSAGLLPRVFQGEGAQGHRACSRERSNVSMGQSSIDREGRGIGVGGLPTDLSYTLRASRER